MMGTASMLGRLLTLAALVYSYGAPGFDGHRPASIDRPLRNFHDAIGDTARDAQRVLVAIDNGVPRLRMLGDNLRRVGEALAAVRD
jgi:hypothetical protein